MKMYISMLLRLLAKKLAREREKQSQENTKTIFAFSHNHTFTILKRIWSIRSTHPETEVSALTFPIARSALSKNRIIPKNRKNTPKPVSPIPISVAWRKHKLYCTSAFVLNSQNKNSTQSLQLTRDLPQRPSSIAFKLCSLSLLTVVQWDWTLTSPLLKKSDAAAL